LFTWPLEPIKNWRFNRLNYVPDVHFQPLYTVGLLSRECRAESSQGRLATITVEEAQRPGFARIRRFHAVPRCPGMRSPGRAFAAQKKHGLAAGQIVVPGSRIGI